MMDFDSDKKEVYDLHLRSEIINMMYHVHTGTKPVAEVSCPGEDFPDLESFIMRHNVHPISYITDKRTFKRGGAKFVTIYFYKYPYLRGILNEYITLMNGNALSSNMRDWIRGKLFGYSDYEIGQFIDRPELAKYKKEEEQ